jgi:hypothetical protein
MRRGNGRVVSKACDIRTHGTFCKNFFVSFFGVKKSREKHNKFVLAHGKSERKVRKGNLLDKVDLKDADFTVAVKKSVKCSYGFTGVDSLIFTDVEKAHNFQTTLYQSISKLL